MHSRREAYRIRNIASSNKCKRMLRGWRQSVYYSMFSKSFTLFVFVFVNKIVPSEFWTGKFFEVVFTSVLEPQSLGFNMADLEVLEKLPEQVRWLPTI